MKHFESWNDFVQAAGLQPTVVSRIDDDVLFRAMYDAFIISGGITTRTKFHKVCRYSADVYARRWGRWENVLAEFRSWAIANASDFPYMVNLPDALSSTTSSSRTLPLPIITDANVSWASKGMRQYGSFLNFRGLQHAPINEQGVVFLFGVVALELGIVVESVRTGFPDCEAKRKIGKEKWERVRIEFEFQSHNFVEHGHDPAQCDLIVCWLDNWPECPIEILELKSAIETLDG